MSVRPNFGRNKLLLPGLAVYASPENLEALKRELSSENRAVEPLTHSSRFSELVIIFCNIQGKNIKYLMFVAILFFSRRDATWPN